MSVGSLHLSSTMLQLVQYAVVIPPAVREEIKTALGYGPKCMFLPHASGAEAKPGSSAGEKSGAGVNTL